MRQTELAYVAGFVDGEGWIGLRHHSGRVYSAPSVTVSNTNEDILLWLKFKFGGTIYHQKSRPRHKQAFAWRLSGRGARTFLHLIHPYLIVKRLQAEVIFEYEMTLIGPRGKGIGVRVSKPTLEFRATLRNRLGVLNKKGA